MRYSIRTHTLSGLCRLLGETHVAVFPMWMLWRTRGRLRFRCWCGALSRSRKFARVFAVRRGRNPVVGRAA